MLKVYVPNSRDSSLVTQDTGIVDRFLEYNKTSSHSTFCNSPSEADLIIIFQGWSFKLPDYARELLSNAMFSKYAHKVYVVNYDSTIGEGFLPGCYVSLKKSNYDQARFRACAYPKIYNKHVAASDAKREHHRYLFSFRGTLHSHPVRQRMFDALSDEPNSLMVNNTKDFHSHTDEEKQLYVKDLIDSQFVLCPRGSSPNSYRLFEAMSTGRCPVIISDEWVETPGPDWSSCSIRVAETDVREIPSLLEKRAHQAQELGKNALHEWRTYFDESAKNKLYLSQILSLNTQAQRPTMTASEYKKYWGSHSFLAANGWTLKQKLLRKITTIFG